jgi:predicted RNA binding protein YcfA (HicA-like mRNA interferase family)
VKHEIQRVRKKILDDGWIYKACIGSHYQYVHPTKKGKVTIPYHNNDISKAVVNSVYKQADLK